MWFEIAERLGMSVARCQLEVSSFEFLEWCIVIEREWNKNTKLDHYLAQIAAEVRRSRAKKGTRIDNKQLLIKFETTKKSASSSKKKKLTKKEVKAIGAKHRAFWFAAVGKKKK